MKTNRSNLHTLFASLAVAGSLAFPTSSPAGLSLQIDIIRNSTSGTYTCQPILSLNGNGPDSTPITYHEVYSPNTNFTGGVGANASNDRDDHPNYAEFISAVTNGPWKLVMNVGDPSQHTYTFHVNAPGLTTNPFNDVTVDFPTNGATNVLPLPVFAWHGPTNADSQSLYVANSGFTAFQFSNPALLATNATIPPALTNGDYLFHVGYNKNLSGLLAITTPLDGLSASPPGWASSETFDLGNQTSFTVFAPDVSTNAGHHTLLAHYTFDDSGNLGLDSSANHNDVLDPGSSWGAQQLDAPSGTAVAGGQAVEFFGESSMTPQGQSFDSWTNTLSGSFSVSAWINTTSVVGFDNEDLFDYTGQSIIYADNNGLGATPIALTGSKVAFLTANPHGNPDTLHSSNAIPHGTYVHIVSTRDQTTGLKKIYLNGVLDSSGFASAETLAGDAYASIGGELSSAYIGLLDDVQIYIGVLTDAEVAELYGNPGVEIPDVTGAPPPAVILAQYSFDNPGFEFHDDTGNGHDMNLEGGWGDGTYVRGTNAIAGAGAAQFVDTNNAQGGFIGYSPSPPADLLSALADSYSISLWLKTTQVYGSDTSFAFEGAGIVWADVGGLANDSVPMALTGHKLGFNTGGSVEDDTLHSTNNIDTGNYVHVVVTRHRANGVKNIYINGVLDSTGLGSTNLLNDSTDLVFGANSGDLRGFNGLLDDIQIYSGVLDPLQVAYLFANPGVTAPATISLTVQLLNPAVVGPDIQFSFRSLAGYLHTVQYSDDLSPGSWHDYATYGGDGTVITINIPTGGHPHRFYRLNTHS